MKRTLKQRVLITTAVVLAGAFCGAAVALVIAACVQIKLADYRLQREAAQLIAAHNAFQDEAHALLTAMNTSHYAFCSDTEIAFFRKLVFNAEYYRDAGHIRDGKILCSATLGRDNLPRAEHFPAVSLPDGMGAAGERTRARRFFCRPGPRRFKAAGPDYEKQVTHGDRRHYEETNTSGQAVLRA